MIHDLKTWPECFQAIKNGSKTFDLRKNDRGFKVGDFLCLKEWHQNNNSTEELKNIDGYYTGFELMVRVTYILEGGQFGLAPDLCIMAITHDEKGWEAIAKSNLEAYQTAINNAKNI